MKIKRITACLLTALILVFAFNIGWIIKDSFFDDIDVLPKGEFLYSSLSPDGEITVSLYKVNTPNSTAIRGAVVSLLEDGTKSERNIFWQLGTDNVIVGWTDNNTVSINEKLIDISTSQVYDSRNEMQELD